jgi:hypothetical protein
MFRPIAGEIAAALPHHHVGHVQAAGDHQHHHQAEAHGDLVADHLRRSAQRAQEGVLRVGCPAGDDDAVHLQRGDGHQEQQAGVDVGQRDVGAEGNHHPGGQRRHDGHDRAEAGTGPCWHRRKDDFLGQQLQRIGDRLQQAQRADAVGAGADLREADGLALPQREVGDRAHQRQHHQHDLDQVQITGQPAGGPPGRADQAVAKAVDGCRSCEHLLAGPRPACSACARRR